MHTAVFNLVLLALAGVLLWLGLRTEWRTLYADLDPDDARQVAQNLGQPHHRHIFGARHRFQAGRGHRRLLRTIGITRECTREGTRRAEDIFIVGVDAPSLVGNEVPSLRCFARAYFTTARKRVNAIELDLRVFFNFHRICV